MGTAARERFAQWYHRRPLLNGCQRHVQVRLHAPGDSFMLGRRVNMACPTDYDCVKLPIYLPGMWMRWDSVTTGTFDVTDQAKSTSHATVRETAIPNTGT